MGLLDRIKSLSIKAKMHLYIGASVVLIMMVSFTYFVVELRNDSRRNATQMAVEQVKGYASQIQKVTNQAIGFSESLASSVVYMFDQSIPNREDLIKQSLLNSAKNNQAFKCIWVSLEHSAITPGYSKPSGRRTFLTVPSSNMPIMSVDKDMDSYDPNSMYYQVKSTGKTDVKEPYFYNYYNNSTDQLLITTLEYPVMHNGQGKGVAGVDLSMEDYQKVVDKIKIFPGTSAFLIAQSGFIAAHTDKALVGKSYDKIFGKDNEELSLAKVLGTSEITQAFTDLNGESYFAVVLPIAMGDRGTTWALGVTIPTSEIFAQSRKSVLFAIVVCLLGILITSFVINYLAKKITKPLTDVTSSIKLLASGAVDKSVALQVNTGDEMEEIAESLNVLVNGLKGTASFAREIGKGNLGAEHELLSNDDVIGKSLLDMQQSLVQAKESEALRKLEEEKERWANQGYADFSEILRQNNDNIQELGFSIISSLVKYLDIVQGGMFILNEDDESDRYLEMVACYAYSRRKLHSKRVEVGEGLVGRCFIEQEPIYLLDIPDSYIAITSGLGDSNPSSLLLVPLKVNNQVNGVIELASLKPIDDFKVKFVERIAESIASTLSSVKINIHTAELLHKTQQQAEEMAAQEEEMRQNLEELQSTQEEMSRIHDEQIKVQEELAQEQMLFSNLMASVPDLIYFKDLNFRITRCSKSLLDLNGQSFDEIVGKNDIERFGEVGYRTMAEEQEIITSGSPMLNVEEKFIYPDGRVQWLNTSKLPLVDSMGKVYGLFGITKDMSDYKAMQESLATEQNLLSNLLESSKEVIYFKDLNLRYLKASKEKLKLHGLATEAQIVGKTDRELYGDKFNVAFEDEERSIISTGQGVVDVLEKVSEGSGETSWLSVSKLPLRDKDGNIVGVWVSYHNVTKTVQLEEKLAKYTSS